MKALLAALAVSLIGSPALRADTAQATQDPAVVQDLADHLSQLEEQVSRAGRDAEILRMISHDHHTARNSHAYYLNNLREDVNSMGRVLAELEQMKPEATETQRMAIENARPHLVAMAHETTKALELVRAGSENIRHSQYKETVAELSKQAAILYQTVDTITDYNNAHVRLHNVEASHDDSRN
jgi:hypothetical protein